MQQVVMASGASHQEYEFDFTEDVEASELARLLQCLERAAGLAEAGEVDAGLHEVATGLQRARHASAPPACSTALEARWEQLLWAYRETYALRAAWAPRPAHRNRVCAPRTIRRPLPSARREPSPTRQSDGEPA